MSSSSPTDEAVAQCLLPQKVPDHVQTSALTVSRAPEEGRTWERYSELRGFAARYCLQATNMNLEMLGCRTS